MNWPVFQDGKALGAAALTQAFADTLTAAVAAAGANVPTLAVAVANTYATLPNSPQGLFLVLADETKGGNPTIYLFNGTHRYWVAMVKDA